MLNYLPPSKNAKKFIAFLICFLCFIFNVIFQLNEQIRDVRYTYEQTETNISEITICLFIKKINCSNVPKSIKLEKCNLMKNLFDYIMYDNETGKTPLTIFQKAKTMNLSDFFILEPGFERANYFLGNNLVTI